MASINVRKAVLEPVKIVSLRTGPRPRWEEEEEEEVEEQSSDEERSESGKKELRSLADSHLILQSLRQSRHIILTTFFLRFSSKSKAKNAPEILQAPHALDFLGKCIFQFGPHMFYGTRFYQVNYTPEHGQQQWPYSQQTWMDAQAYALTQPAVPAVTPYTPQPSTSPQMSLPPNTPGAGIELTSELIAEVDAATAADPELAHIRALAAENKASTAQLHKLGSLIQAINSRSTPRESPSATARAEVSASPVPQAPAPSVPATPVPSVPYNQAYQAPYTKPTRRPDIVFEFRENPTERWLLPCDNAMLERRKGEDGTVEVLLSTFLHGEDPTLQTPAKVERDGSGSKSPESEQKLLPATIHFLDVPEILWHALMYCSDFNNPASRAQKITVFEDMIKSAPPRVYLQHRLPVGPLPADLEEAVVDKFAPKPYNASSHRVPSSPSIGRQGSSRGTVIGPDGVPVKKERKYAMNRWKDGTPRWCQGCGTTETGAWRRGPNGPGTLCGSCGSKFKTRPETFKLPDHIYTPEEVLEMEVKRKEARERKAADVAAAAQAAAEKAEKAAAAALAAAEAPETPEQPYAKRRRRPTSKGELEPWPAFTQPQLGAHLIPSNSSSRSTSTPQPPPPTATATTHERKGKSRETTTQGHSGGHTYNGRTYATYEEAYAAWYEYARAYDAQYYGGSATATAAQPSSSAASYSAEYDAWYRQYYSAYAAHYGDGYYQQQQGSQQGSYQQPPQQHQQHQQRAYAYNDPYAQQQHQQPSQHEAAPYQPYYSSPRPQDDRRGEPERHEYSSSRPQDDRRGESSTREGYSSSGPRDERRGEPERRGYDERERDGRAEGERETMRKDAPQAGGEETGPGEPPAPPKMDVAEPPSGGGEVDDPMDGTRGEPAGSEPPPGPEAA